jgi:predicted Rossmann fold nucleotide-binding protein DprA/Smf involved in DNA uptake
MENRIDRNIAEVMRDEMIMEERILSQLSEDPKTIPEIAAALEYPANDVVFWVMTMWRYGSLEEVGKPNEEGYYKYRPVK